MQICIIYHISNYTNCLLMNCLLINDRGVPVFGFITRSFSSSSIKALSSVGILSYLGQTKTIIELITSNTQIGIHLSRLLIGNMRTHMLPCVTSDRGSLWCGLVSLQGQKCCPVKILRVININWQLR